MTTQNHWTKVANLVKTKITVVDNANNRLSGSKLLADIKNGQCLSKWEPELCIKMLQLPGVDNYLAIKKLIRKANKEWIVEFLERDGLGTLMNSLRSMGGKSLMDTIGQLQCVECLRAVVRSRTGLQYISSHLEYSSYLASAVLMCNNTTVKLQVYELLCALCVFSADGMIFAKSVLSHVKMKRELRHDYEIVVMELQQADTFAYQTTLLAFVNCLVLVEQNLRKRMRVRNELLALGLRSAIDNMAGYEDEALQIQIAVFEENHCADEIQEPQISHQQLLEKLRAKISNTLYDSYLQNMLLQMSEMDYGDAKVNDVWNLINDVMCNDAQTMLNVYRKTSKTHSTGCQTDGKRLNDRRASLSSPNGRRRSLDVSAKDTDNNNNNSKRTGGFVCKTDRRPSLPRGTVGRGSVENARPVETPTTTARRSISTQTDRFCDAEPNNDRPTVSSDAVNSCSTSCLLSSAASIPPPPPPPPFSLSEVPAPPPFPVPSAIPPPPPFSLSEVPPPPPLPVPSAIPPSPPFFFSEVPPPPPPPPSAAATSPPLPPTTVGLSELGRTDFAVPNISDGHRTVPTRRTSNNIKYYSLPKTKMKTLNWTKVNNQYLDKSIWSSTDPPNLTINFRKIEELFCQKPRAKSSPAVLSPNAASKANVVHVLDSKRSLAINIMLKQFKTGGNEIIEALQNGTSIPLEKLKGLQRVLPTDEEMKTIRKRAGDSATLGTAELFCLDLDSISNYQLRIKLMIEKEELPVTLSEIHAQLEGIKDMCHNLISDQPFKQFLSLVLFIGNYLNAGSYAGNASGFTLDTLPKLLDTRANKPRVTFLHFVVEVAQTNTNDILSFTKYTSALRNLSRISFSSLEDEIKIITKQIRSLHSELSKHTKKQIYTQFSDFMKQSVEDVERLNEVYKSTTEVIGRVAVHFGEDVKKFKIEECLGLLGNFFERIDVAAKENINRRVQEEKNKMLALKLENEKDGPTNIKRRARGPAAFKDEEVCIVDLVLQDIRRGSFNLRSVKSEDEKRI